MPWNWLLDQPRVQDVLQRALERDRTAHAYLFHGPDGSGKRAAALALAQALNCTQRGRSVGAGEACGVCPACQKVARLVHPDVKVYFPRPSDATPEDVAARLQRLAEDPYAEIDYRRRPVLDSPDKTPNKQTQYSADFMREVILHEQRFAPAEGAYKVALLLDVDAMHPTAANAFLKLLEEPPPRTVFVATASRPDRVLPTILSRCQRLRFDALAPEQIEAGLVGRGVEARRAAFVARMADGSFTRALTLLESETLAEHRETVVAFLRAAYGLQGDKLWPLIEKVAGMGREPLKGWLGLVEVWVRDLVLVHTLGASAPLVNVDQREAIERFVQHVPSARHDAMAALVERAIFLVERNAHTTLVLTVLAEALHAAMQGRDRSALFAPLDEPALAG